MKISIITVCKNSADTIEATLRSVRSQSHEDVEHIVMDGASTDGTLDILEKYRSDIDVLVSEKDAGLYYAINKGMEKARGEVIGILNSDDVYEDDDVLEKIAEKFSDQQTDALYGDLVYVDRKKTDKVIRFWKSGPYKEGLFKAGWMPPHPTFYVRKSVLDKHGGYDTSFTSASDYELMLRLVHKHRIRLAYIPEVLVRMRLGGKSNASLTGRIKANREDRRAWEVNGLDPGAFTLIRKPLGKISQYFKKQK